MTPIARTPTWLTGAAGLMLVVAAVVMMVAAAPSRTHPQRPAITHSVPAARLVSSQQHAR